VALGDDGVNVHAQTDNPVYSVDVAGQSFKTNPGAPVAQGDVLLLVSVPTDPPGGRTSFPAVKPTHVKVTLPPELVDSGTRWKVTVAAIPGETLQSDVTRFTNVSSSAESYIIRNSQFTHIRGRGALLLAGFGLVTENHYDWITDFGLSFESWVAYRDGDGFREGPYPRDTVVRFNAFGTNVGYASGASKIRIMAQDLGMLLNPSGALNAPLYQGIVNYLRNNQGLSTANVSIPTQIPGQTAGNPEMNQP